MRLFLAVAVGLESSPSPLFPWGSFKEFTKAKKVSKRKEKNAKQGVFGESQNMKITFIFMFMWLSVCVKLV